MGVTREGVECNLMFVGSRRLQERFFDVLRAIFEVQMSDAAMLWNYIDSLPAVVRVRVGLVEVFYHELANRK